MAPGATGPETIPGTVIRRSSNMAWVDTGGGVLACEMRGKLRQGLPCVAGDRVRVRATGPGTGVVEELCPRRSSLSRGAVTGEPGAQITAANLDRVAVVISAASPPPRWGVADRLLVQADREGLEGLVILNKADLAPLGSTDRTALDEAMNVYRAAGIPAFTVSAVTGSGIPELAAALADAITVFSGHSGVGKTTLLNALVPGAALPTGEVNDYTGKGRQTTTSVILVKLPGGGYITDTPGFREFALGGMDPAELGRRYPEFRESIAACRFNDCLHRGEPGCAVREAVAQGRISKLRYQTYLQILSTLLERNSDRSPRRSAGKGSPDPS